MGISPFLMGRSLPVLCDQEGFGFLMPVTLNTVWALKARYTPG